MSFDLAESLTLPSCKCRFNPFGTGRCLSTGLLVLSKRTHKDVSIPLGQGGVFRPWYDNVCENISGFNPFGTGRCLSTSLHFNTTEWVVSFQSLWDRAVSLDENNGYA